LKSTLQVLNNEALYERDGTSFHSMPDKNTLIETLNFIGIKNKTILDMGGGLGSTYICYQDVFLKKVSNYIVFEQEKFYDIGNKLSTEHNLDISFINNISNIKEKIDIVICSSFLQYIQDFIGIVNQILRLNSEFILIDRNPVTNDDSKIFVQLNSGYYEKPVTYPLHIINEREFIDAFHGYTLIKSWNSDFDPPYFKGYLFKRNKLKSK